MWGVGEGPVVQWIVDNTLDYQYRDGKTDPLFLQSFRSELKPRYHLRIDLVVGGTLSQSSLTHFTGGGGGGGGGGQQ